MSEVGNAVTSTRDVAEASVTLPTRYPVDANPCHIREVTRNACSSYARARISTEALPINDRISAFAAERGFPELKPAQMEIVAALAQQQDVLGIIPTGGGKTLPAHLITARRQYGLTVAVFPLIALAADQDRRARDIGLRTVVWNSTLSDSKKEAALQAIEADQVDMLLTTAESLQRRDLQMALLGKVGLAWADEAHTATKDHNFRPAWGRVGRIFDEIRPVMRYACTATSEPAEQEELARRCGLTDYKVVRVPVQRDNLSFEHVERSTHSIRAVLRAHRDARILVYAATVKTVGTLAAELGGNGFHVAEYHGSLTKRGRESVLRAFTAGEVRNVVATDAFGLGVDLPDIRAICCFDPAADIAAFVQQAGRAGRDGKPSRIYIASMDAAEGWRTRGWLIKTSFPPVDDMRRIWQELRRAGPSGVNASQQDIAETAGVENFKHIAGRAFNYLKRKSLVAEQHVGRDFTYFARGQFDAVNWLDYHADKEKALQKLDRLRELWALHAENIPAAIAAEFNEVEASNEND